MICRGASPGTNTEEFVARVERLKEEVRKLDSIEKGIDKHRQVSAQLTKAAELSFYGYQ